MSFWPLKHTKKHTETDLIQALATAKDKDRRRRSFFSCQQQNQITTKSD